MLNLAISESLLTQQSERVLKRLKKKMERDLSRIPGVVLHFQVQPKTKKQSKINTFLQVSNETFHHQEFDARSWESALEQTVNYAIRFVRRDLPYLRQDRHESRFLPR